jgi:hypothetical protein
MNDEELEMKKPTLKDQFLDVTKADQEATV